VLVNVLACGASRSATLSFDAPMHIQADESSPVMGTLPAGTSITTLLRSELAAAGLDQPPSGWVVLRSSGPFTGFVRNSDVDASGNITPGAEIRVQPLADAPLLLVVEPADVATAREPLGDWSRATVSTELFVYVNTLPVASRSQVANNPDNWTPVSDAPADTPAVGDGEAAAEDAPAKPTKPKKTREPKVEPTPVETTGAPRTFVGYLMPTRRFLGRGPKYPYQLVDDNNKRIALLDVSALLATTPIENFESRRISIYGPGVTRPDVQDLIIRVQTLRLEK
jgi:hypothetical protein